MQFMSDAGIKMVHLGLKSWTLSQKAKEGSDEPLLREELIKEAIEMVLDQQNHPLVLMCQSGVQETGLVVGCLRRLQGGSSVVVNAVANPPFKKKLLNLARTPPAATTTTTQQWMNRRRGIGSKT